MSGAHDVVVVGAGPAGAGAALAASDAGLRVALLDEAPDAGGQIYRAPVAGAAVPRVLRDRELAEGLALRADLAKARIDLRFKQRVWSVSQGFRVDAIGPNGKEEFYAPRLIAATGAWERVIPFPGWTLPGVIGLAAATILLKSQHMLPGRRAVIAGAGPLLAAVAAKILKCGGEVEAIVDVSDRSEWLKAVPRLASRPGLLARGAAWALKISRAGVPVLSCHAIRRVEGDGHVRRVIVGPVDGHGRPLPGQEQVFEADCLAVGNGLVPGSEIPRLLGAQHRFERSRGGWVPVLDDDGRTSIAGLYAAGDGSGLRGAVPAGIAGRLAGLAAARDRFGPLPETHEGTRARLLADLQRSLPFANAMAELMSLRPAQVAGIPHDTVVCRCEDVTRAEIDAAADAGAGDLNQLKHFTRCGMGPCQGRMCGDVAAELLAQKLKCTREAVGQWTARPPLRPVPLEALLGEFTYDDIPVPTPVPA